MNPSAHNDGDDVPAAVPDAALLKRAFDTDGESFFDDPDIRQRLNLIRHLVQSTRLTILISGVPGSGKTTCLDQLQRTADERWVLCRVAGSACAEPGRVLGRVARCCDLPPDCGTPALRQLLAEHAATLTRNARLPVIAVDDAHALQREALAELAALSAGEEGWHLLLFAEPGHGQLFEAAGLTSPGRLHSLEWPPLAEPQSGAYVLHRLSAAGWSGGQPLTIEQIRKLQRESGGLPGAINRLAPKLFARKGTAAPKPPPGPKANSARLRYVLRGAALLVVVAAVAVVLWQQERINALFEQPSAPAQTPPLADRPTDDLDPETARLDPAPDAAIPPAIAPAEPRPALPERDGDDPPAAQAPELGEAPVAAIAPPAPESPADRAEPSQPPHALGPQALPGEIPSPADTEQAAQAPVPPGDSDMPPVQAPETATASSPPQEDLPAPREPAPEPAPIPPAQGDDDAATDMTAESATAAAPATEPGAEMAPSPPGTADVKPQLQPQTTADAGAKWVLSRAPDHYTLQLLGSRELKPLQEVMDRYHLHTDTAWYKIQYRGGDWYVLVHGDYADSRAASQAVAALPAGLRRAGPWPRPLAAVQQEVRRGHK